MRRVGAWALFHALFAMLTVGLGWSGIVSVPDALLAGVVAYNLSIPVFADERDEPEPIRIWTFLLPLSALMVVPDWFLCTVLETLVFPASRGTAIVPSYMAGLWTVSLFGPVWAGRAVASRRSPVVGGATAALFGAAVFAGGELVLTAVPIWRAVDVQTVGGLALYILPAEIMLAFGAWYGYEATRRSRGALRIGAAALLMLAYLGAACTSYLVVERMLGA